MTTKPQKIEGGKKKRTYTLDEIANYMSEPEVFKKEVQFLAREVRLFDFKYGSAGLKVLLELIKL
jgi:hypothetical protein